MELGSGMIKTSLWESETFPYCAEILFHIFEAEKFKQMNKDNFKHPKFVHYLLELVINRLIFKALIYKKQ